MFLLHFFLIYTFRILHIILLSFLCKVSLFSLKYMLHINNSLMISLLHYCYWSLYILIHQSFILIKVIKSEYLHHFLAFYFLQLAYSNLRIWAMSKHLLVRITHIKEFIHIYILSESVKLLEIYFKLEI